MSGQYEDDMVRQSSLINHNCAVGRSPVLQTQNLVLEVGRVGEGFLGYHQVPVRSDVSLLFISSQLEPHLDFINNLLNLIYLITLYFKQGDFGLGTKNP